VELATSKHFFRSRPGKAATMDQALPYCSFYSCIWTAAVLSYEQPLLKGTHSRAPRNIFWAAVALFDGNSFNTFKAESTLSFRTFSIARKTSNLEPVAKSTDGRENWSAEV